MSSLIVELNLPKGLVEVLDVPESQHFTESAAELAEQVAAAQTLANKK